MVIKKLFPIIDLLLIALAIYIGVKGVYTYFSYRLDTLPPPATVARFSAGTEDVKLPPFSNYRAVAKRNLFNTGANGKKLNSNILVDSLEQTQLKLKLWGTAAGDPDRSWAVIEDEKERKQRLYKKGDTIQNASVKLILRGKVVLSLNGKDEILEVEKINEQSAPLPRAISRRSTTSSMTNQTTRARRRISLNRAQVDDAMNNLNELMGQINIQPHKGGDGMILSNIKPNSIFRRMGLRNGDILTSIDGQPITNVDGALKLYEDLKSSDKANVEITRKGRPTTIEYNIR